MIQAGSERRRGAPSRQDRRRRAAPSSVARCSESNRASGRVPRNRSSGIPMPGAVEQPARSGDQAAHWPASRPDTRGGRSRRRTRRVPSRADVNRRTDQHFQNPPPTLPARPNQGAEPTRRRRAHLRRLAGTVSRCRRKARAEAIAQMVRPVARHAKTSRSLSAGDPGARAGFGRPRSKRGQDFRPGAGRGPAVSRSVRVGDTRVQGEEHGGGQN